MSSRFVLAALVSVGIAGCSSKAPAPAGIAAASPIPAEAIKAYNEQDFDRAAVLLSKLLETEPTSRPALDLYIRTTQRQGLKAKDAARGTSLTQSARAARKLRDTYRPLTVDESRLVIQALYNDACVLAQTGEQDQALKALAEAVDAGWIDPAHLENDPDLVPIRNRPEFAQLKHDAGLQGAARALARNHPFPFHFRLPNAQGKLVSLDDFRGKVVIVNFWASWSPPCRRLAPLLADLDRKFREKGLEIVGLNDEKTDPAAAAFLAEFPSPYPQLQLDDATKKLLPRWDGYPTTLLIDRQGKVRLLLEGFSPVDGAGIEQAVTTLLAEQ